MAKQIESETQAQDYPATQDELRIIDVAIASIDAGETATEAAIRTVFAKLRSARN